MRLLALVSVKCPVCLGYNSNIQVSGTRCQRFVITVLDTRRPFAHSADTTLKPGITLISFAPGISGITLVTVNPDNPFGSINRFSTRVINCFVVPQVLVRCCQDWDSITPRGRSSGIGSGNGVMLFYRGYTVTSRTRVAIRTNYTGGGRNRSPARVDHNLVIPQIFFTRCYRLYRCSPSTRGSSYPLALAVAR